MAEFICPNCGTAGKPKVVTKGNLFIEVFLWLCFIVPGLIYSIWRLTTRHKACRACGAPNLVPADSPMGLKLRNEFGQRAQT